MMGSQREKLNSSQPVDLHGTVPIQSYHVSNHQNRSLDPLKRPDLRGHDPVAILRS